MSEKPIPNLAHGVDCHYCEDEGGAAPNTNCPVCGKLHNPSQIEANARKYGERNN